MKYKGITLLVILLGLFHNSVWAMDNPLLKQVPHDSLFFSGNTQLIPISDYPMMDFSHSFEPPLSQNERQELGKELHFFYEIFLDFEQMVPHGNRAIQRHYGLPDWVAAVAYTVGVTPVIKIHLQNEQAFLSVLDKAEQASGFAHMMSNFEGESYRRYTLDAKHNFIVHIQTQENGTKVATLALLSRTLSEQSKKQIFGLSQPTQSIADTGKVSAIEKEQQYLPVSVSFLDFEQLVKSLFQEQDNPWAALFGDEDKTIAELQASNCEADVLAIASDMPRLIAGYKNYQVQGQRINMDFELLLELKNQNVKAELNQFRGFIPDYIRSGAKEHILALGLGANMSQLSPMFFYLTKAFRESTFTCAPLIEMQQDVAKLNPAMLALVTGIVDGVHGVGFALQNFKLKAPAVSTSPSGSQAMTDLSMILSMAAENPIKVWQMLSAFVPEIAMIAPSEKPQRLNLAALEQMGLDVFVVAKGQHMALYTGAKAETITHTLMNEKIATNGFFQESLNYSRLTNAVKELRDYMASNEAPETITAEACNYFDESIAMLSRLGGFIDFQSDFVSSGWLNAMTADIEMRSPEKVSSDLIGQYETLYVQDGCQLARDGREEIKGDGTGFYQQYSDDGKCFIFETRYRWSQVDEQINLQYVSERSRPDGLCTSPFDEWAVPEPEFVNDVCQLRTSKEGEFACLYQWDDVLTKSVYKRI